MEVRVVAVDEREMEDGNGGRSGGVKAAENLGVVLEARGEGGDAELRWTAEDVVVDGLVRSEDAIGVGGETPPR